MPGQLSAARNQFLPGIARLARRPTQGDERTILIIQPDHLGDMLLSQPAVRRLRIALPEHKLVGVVGPWSSEITRLVWPVDEIIEVRFPGFDRSNTLSRLGPYRLLYRESARLRRLSAGSAVVLRPDAWWAAWLARMSVSGTVAGASDSRVMPFVDVSRDVHDDQHAADRAISIAEGLTTDAADISDRDPVIDRPPDEVASETLQRLNIRRPHIVVHPGAGAPVKHWPSASWRSALARLSDYQILLTGTPGEQDLCTAIARGLTHVRSIAGETTLQDLIAVLANATAVLGTDNGPMHVAVALGTPTVHLYGPSSVLEFGPRGDPSRHRVVTAGWTCPHCRNLDPSRPGGCGCMLAITPELVLRELRELLDFGLNDAIGD